MQHTENAPQQRSIEGVAQNERRWVGAGFCSMKITQAIRASAQAGMQGKAREFRETGGEIYVPAVERS